MSGARCEVIPGSGSVARYGDSLLWASDGTPESVWDTLVACLGLGTRAAASAAVLHGLAETMLPDLGDGTSFALVVGDGTAGFVLRQGAVTVLVDGTAVEGDPLSQLVPGAALLLGAPAAVDDAAASAPTYRHDLEAGAVPGGALRWTSVPRPETPAVPAEPPAAIPPPGPPEPTPSDGGPETVFEPVDLPTSADPIPPAEPEATEFHPPPDPDAPPTDYQQAGAGALVFEDGATIALHGDVVLGRRPDSHELVRSGQAQPVVIHDPDHVLSGSHAAIRFHGHDVVVVDLDSLNGTHVAAPEAREWTRLTPGAPFQMRDGYRMLLGWTVLTYRR